MAHDLESCLVILFLWMSSWRCREHGGEVLCIYHVRRNGQQSRFEDEGESFCYPDDRDLDPICYVNVTTLRNALSMCECDGKPDPDNKSLFLREAQHVHKRPM
jgi:hypothetical protein